MIRMLSPAPSCRSASSSLWKQVAVMLVAVSECNWLNEAENEKFPSPTSNTDSERDICSPNGNDRVPKTQLPKWPPPNLLSFYSFVPKEETRVGATVATSSLLHDLVHHNICLLQIRPSNIRSSCPIQTRLNNRDYIDSDAEWSRWPSSVPAGGGVNVHQSRPVSTVAPMCRRYSRPMGNNFMNSALITLK